MPTSFIDRVLRGENKISEVDEFIEQWHFSDGSISLNEHLGMTEVEYEAFAKDETVLHSIIFSRRNPYPFQEPQLMSTDTLQDPIRIKSHSFTFNPEDKNSSIFITTDFFKESENTSEVFTNTHIVVKGFLVFTLEKAMLTPEALRKLADELEAVEDAVADSLKPQ